MDEINAGHRSLAGLPALPEVKDIGQIDLMKLPLGFVIGKSSQPGFTSSFFQEYHLEADPTVKVYFEYRGKRMSSDSSDRFRDLLTAPPHNLSQGELEQLGEVLQAKSDHARFRTMVAKTQDINGKRVLVIE